MRGIWKILCTSGNNLAMSLEEIVKRTVRNLSAKFIKRTLDQSWLRRLKDPMNLRKITNRVCRILKYKMVV